MTPILHLSPLTDDILAIWEFGHTSARNQVVWQAPLTGYIDEFEVVDDHRAGKIVVMLNGRLNKCGVISPRFDVCVTDIEKWTTNLLPSRQFG